LIYLTFIPHYQQQCNVAATVLQILLITRLAIFKIL
jgi:hypothetical protein